MEPEPEPEPEHGQGGEGSFAAGQSVEYHSRSRDKWVGATVRRVNRDGTLHIELEDGRSDHAINPKYVRHRRSREDQAATQIQGVLRGHNARADARVQRSMRAFDEMEYSDGTTQTLSRFACG